MKTFLKGNRKRLSNFIKNGSACVLFSGKAPYKAGDEKYPFTPNRNFYYMTGLESENFIYLIYKFNDTVNEFIFINRYDEDAAKWTVSSPNKSLTKDISGIENIKYVDEFESFLSSIIFNNSIKVFMLDIEKREVGYSVPSLDFADFIKREYQYIKIENIYNFFADMRMIKQEYEIENIKKAAEITKHGIYSIMKNIRVGMYEYEAEAYFDFELKKRGVKDKAFNTIMASGKNGCILHYDKNDSIINDGELVLFELGAKYGYYSADVTRTIPANGKFSKRQRQIYDIVLEGQKFVIGLIKPEIEFSVLNKSLREFYLKELKKIGLISEDGDDKCLFKYYYHGVSHPLGLETHDAGRFREGVIKENMVLTVEPGLYIENEKIGIRIEDDVLVTKNGCEVLTKDIIKDADKIEMFMSEAFKNA